MYGLATKYLSSIPMADAAHGYRGKRLFDVVGAAALTIGTAPVSLLVYVAVRLASPGPALFRQVRTGQDGRMFVIWKFRTLRSGSGISHDLVLEGDPRLITLHTIPLGAWLRGTHLDELPQLLQVVRGEMSLVGPRPDTPEKAAERLERNPRHRELLGHKPGLVGWVCLNGKWEQLEKSNRSFNATDEELRFLRKESLSTNIRLLARVAVKLFVR